MPPPRPQRDLTAVVNAERPRRVLVPPHIAALCRAPWPPHTSLSHASSTSPSSLRHPTSMPSQTSCRSSYSRTRCPRRTAVAEGSRVVPSGSTPVGPVPSFERDSKQPAAILVSQQRVNVEAPSLFLSPAFSTRSRLHRARPRPCHARARARERVRERERKNSHARIVHPPSPTRNDNTALLCVFFYYRLALYLRKSVFVTSTNTVQPSLFDIRAFLASLSHRTLSFYFPLLFLSLSFYREPVREFLSLSFFYRRVLFR